MKLDVHVWLSFAGAFYHGRILPPEGGRIRWTVFVPTTQGWMKTTLCCGQRAECFHRPVPGLVQENFEQT